MATKENLAKDSTFEYDHKEVSLGLRAVKGGVWIFVLKVAHRGLGFLRTLILARLLSPEDFGLFGIAVLTINFLENFSVTGIDAALVQKKGSIKEDLDTAWTVNVIRSLLLFSTLYFGAPVVASFFNNTEALDIIKALAFLQLCTGAENIATVYFRKEIRFNKLFNLNFSAMTVNFVVSVTMAIILKSVWALVYGALAGAFIKTVMSYVLQPYRPRLRFEVAKLKELLRFGKWIFGSSILVFLITEGDDVFVGKMLGTTALGLYQMAYLLSNAPATEISNFVAQITFPVYSKMQGDVQRLREAYLKVLQIVSFIAFPISGLIFIFAPDFTKLFLGEKWMPMVPALQVLTLWGLIRAVGTTTTQIFLAVGKPRITTKLRSLELLFIAILIYPLTVRFGILGTAMTIVIGTILPVSITCLMAVKTVNSDLFSFGKILLLPLIGTFAMTGVIVLSKMHSQGGAMLLINLFVGPVIYLCVETIGDRFFGYDMWSPLRRILADLKK
jgi:lipopolysaccharide exporter